MRKSEIEESNRHFREVWQMYAKVSPQGEAFDKDGLSFANSKQPWFFMNVGLLNRPVQSHSDLEHRAERAVEYFRPSKNPWILVASEDWFGPDSNSVLGKLGLVFKLDLMGMLAERLNPATRPLPDVDLRRIEDKETRFAIADLNADAYGVPREWGRLAISSDALWQGPLYGTIASIGNEPASGAFVVPIDKALYVAWVATAEAHRKLGLAELVIRKSLEDAMRSTGLERTVLHATKYGLPVYARMGYRSVMNFPLYGPR